MHLDYSEKGKFKISINDYMDKIINEFPEVIKRTASTPAVDYLLQIRDETEASKLDEERANAFHCIFALLVFFNGQARLDVQTTVPFLTTCFKN